MKVKQYLKEIKPLLKERDFICIYCNDKNINYRYIIHDIEKQIKLYPLLAETDIIKTKIYDSKWSDGINGNINGVCKEYSAEIDFDQYYLAIHKKAPNYKQPRKKKFKL